GLGGRSKASNDAVNNHNIYEEQDKLRARRHADVQHLAPDFCLRTEERKTETKIMIFFLEIDHDQDVRGQNGDETGKRCARHAESRPRANSENEQRCEHDVEHDTEYLEPDGGF